MKVLKNQEASRAKLKIAFTQKGRTLAIPQELLEEASGKTFTNPPHICFEVEKGHAKSYIYITARKKADETHKWKTWRSNAKSRRFYVSVLSVLSALGIQGDVINGHETKGKIIGNKIRIRLEADYE